MRLSSIGRHLNASRILPAKAGSHPAIFSYAVLNRALAAEPPAAPEDDGASRAAQ